MLLLLAFPVGAAEPEISLHEYSHVLPSFVYCCIYCHTHALLSMHACHIVLGSN